MKTSLLLLAVFAGMMVTHARAADPSIDRLLNKLPPPERFVDPAMSDPLTKKIEAAAKAKNFGAALGASRQLAKRHPKSLGAQMVHAMIAMSLRRYPEASAAYRKALSIRPDLAVAYVGLGLSEAAQRHFRVALTHFQKVTRLAPQADIGWIGASACSEGLGRRKESLEYARRATVVAPSSPGAWYQLARQEGIAGNRQASVNALVRATNLQKAAARKRPKR